MVIVDASVLIDFFAGRANPESLWLREQLDSQRIGITSLTLCEVMQGVRSDKDFQHIFDILSRFAIFEVANKQLALASALNYRFLRANSYTVRNTIDCLIATFCIQQEHVLLHSDRDFDAFEKLLGLAVLHPPESSVH